VAQSYHNTSNNALWAPTNFLSNTTPAAIADNWQTDNITSTLSDRWIQNASFLKCDNISLGYNFSDLFKQGRYHGISGRVYTTVTNVFTITKYDGIDPEVFDGNDNQVYPRPFSLIIGVNMNF
jgi:iron complex outermembrane receptor protein